MKDQLKHSLLTIKEKYESWMASKWGRNVRITSSVLWNLGLIFLIILITGTVFVGSVGAGYFASLVKDEPLRSKEQMRTDIFSYEETSELYFANNIYIGKVDADLERKETKLEEVSPHVIDAVLATEDEYFNDHQGIVPKAIFRGLLQDVSNSDTQTGGSTLTQQLIKNQILTNEVSYERKAKEILLAMRLEHFMDKNEILEAYLNIIPYGRNASGRNIAGIETAAEGIFNKKAKDLNLPQAAYIAGLPQAPFAYTPFQSGNRGLKDEKGLQPGIDRMKTVLFRMKETGYITENEYNEAVNYDITKDFREPAPRATERYPFLTIEIQERAIQILAETLAVEDGIDPARLKKEENLLEKYKILGTRALKNGGYRIHTTIDKKMYDAAQKVKDEFELYGPTFKKEVIDPDTNETITIDEPVQVGTAVIENSTGKILSFVGGREFIPEQMELNHLSTSTRSIGSTMKPIGVYAPAIEFGFIGAGSPVVDVQFSIPDGGKMYEPKNVNVNEELGIIPAREALAKSQNLATLRLYREIRDRRPDEFLYKMGFTSIGESEYINPSFAIGTSEASVEETTNAYAVLANGGKFVDAYMIERIEDADGNVVFQHEPKPVDVFSPQTAYIVTDMLRDTLDIGTARTANGNLNFRGDFAAKTGTSNGTRDSWFIGYNPNISVGVWFGYDDHSITLNQMNNRYRHPSTRINLFWSNMMNAMNEANPEVVNAGATFKQPEGVVSRAFCGISGLAPSEACSAAGLVTSDLFNANVMLPNKADDSLISSSYVMIDGSRYRALDSTPREFVVEGGVGVNEDFIKRMLGPYGGDASKLFPSNSLFSSRVVSEAVFEADGAAPASVSASINGSTLTWTKSASNDVIGYRVFRRTGAGNDLVASVLESANYNYTVGNGEYFVVAVDITGKQSPASNIVENAPEAPPPPPPPSTPPGGGNGGGSGGGDTPPPDDSNPPPGNGGGNGNGNGNGGGIIPPPGGIIPPPGDGNDPPPDDED